MLPVGVPRQVTFVVACRFPKNPALSRVSDPKRLYFCTVIGRPEAVRSADRPACELQCRWSRGPEGLRRRLQPAVSARLLCIRPASVRVSVWARRISPASSGKSVREPKAEWLSDERELRAIGQTSQIAALPARQIAAAIAAQDGDRVPGIIQPDRIWTASVGRRCANLHS